MDCWDINDILSLKNDVGSAFEYFGTSTYKYNNKFKSHIGRIYNVQQLREQQEKLDDLMHAIEAKEFKCSNLVGGWQQWWGNQLSSSQIKDKIRLTRKNIDDFIDRTNEETTGMKIKREDSKGGSKAKRMRTRKFKCRTSICVNKKRKYKSRKRDKRKKRNKTRRMKAGTNNIHTLIEKSRRGSTRGIQKQSIPRSFFEKSDGKQARINSISPEEKKSLSHDVKPMAAIRKRFKK